MYYRTRRLLVCLYANDVFIYRTRLIVYTVMVYVTEHITHRNCIGARFLFIYLDVIQFNIPNGIYQDQVISDLITVMYNYFS